MQIWVTTHTAVATTQITAVDMLQPVDGKKQHGWAGCSGAPKKQQRTRPRAAATSASTTTTLPASRRTQAAVLFCTVYM